MVVRGFRWGGPITGVILGLLAFGGVAVAQEDYVGDVMCKNCHKEQYATYMKHGHPWMTQTTDGTNPPMVNGKPLAFPASPEFPGGVPLPTLCDGMTWSDVQEIFGNFKEGTGEMVAKVSRTFVSNGVTVKLSPGGIGTGTSYGTSYTGRCVKCHNTGYSTTGNQYGLAGYQGTWALPGIQCEQCHGAGPTMAIPDKQICRDCHSRTDDAGDANHKVQVAFTSDHKKAAIVNGHNQGDEYRRSPHKNIGCAACHDPHKSVWHEQGGVMYAETVGEGNMCKHCHQKHVRGTMGEEGIDLECVDCHMPQKSGTTYNRTTSIISEPVTSTRRTHIFRINSTNLTVDGNITQDAPGSAKYWLNSTDLNGDASLTLDMVCKDCHTNMSMDQLAKAAKTIHRQPGLVDLTVNNSDSVQVVSRATQVSVDLSVELPDSLKGKNYKGNWSVLCQGPKGWTSWNGKKWVAGNAPWLKATKLADKSVKVLNAKLAPGFYHYWVTVAPSNSQQKFATAVDSVSVYVTP